MPLADDFAQLTEFELLRARRLLHTVVDEMPRSADARTLLAKNYLRSLEFETALSHFRAAAALDEKASEPAINIGLCHLWLDQYEEALAVLQQVIERHRSAYALTVAALLLHRLGRIPEAIDGYRSLLARTKQDSAERPHALQGLVMALRDAGRFEEADEPAAQLLLLLEQKPLLIANTLAQRNSTLDFFEWSSIADKASLARMFGRRTANRPHQARFHPATFVLPDDAEALAAYAADAGEGAIFIGKPRHGFGGQGMMLTENAGDFRGRQDLVVQRYIDDPYLVDGKKAHLRIYGLIASVDPLRAYVYGEGIVRFAPERFARGPGWLDRIGMHVTNTALHRGHPELKISEAGEENVGNIWSLGAYLRQCAADGLDSARLFQDLAGLVCACILTIDESGLFAHQRARAPRRSFAMKLFGVDVLVDRVGRPWVLEMQRKPAGTGAPLVNRLNGEMFATIVRMSIGKLYGGAPFDGSPAAALARERKIETANQGKFLPLALT